MTTFDVEFLAHELASWQRQLDAGSTRLSRFFFLFFFLITTNGKSIDDERHTCVEGEAGQGRLNSSERWHFHTLPLGTLVALAYVFAKVCFVFFFFFSIYTTDARQSSLCAGDWGVANTYLNAKANQTQFRIDHRIGTILNEIIMPIMKSFLIVACAFSQSNK